jgi:excisionase family DNA binding protein
MKVTLGVTAIWIMALRQDIARPEMNMVTFPNNGKQERDRSATILPIQPGTHHGWTSSLHSDGGDDRDGIDASKIPRRLTFTVDEAAFLLNISRGLAYELVARGELASIRLGRRIVIPRVVLEELTGTTIT